MLFRKFKSGFTLIEAIIALTILVIGILAVLTFLPGATKMAIVARHQTQAAFLAQGKMEEYLAKSYAELETGIVEPRAPMVSDTGSQLYYFETEVEIIHIDGDFQMVAEDEGMKKIEVTTYWNEGSQERQEKLVTVVSRY